MHIVFITPSLKTGGGNRMFIELANLLCLEHQVTVLYPNNSPEKHTFFVNPTVRFAGVGNPATGKLSKLHNFFRAIRYANKHYRNDVVVYSDPLFSLFAEWLRAKRRFRFVQADDYRIFDDGYILGTGLRLKLYKFFCKRSFTSKRTRFIFNSQFVYNCFCNDSGRNDVPCLLVHPAVSANIFSPDGREKLNTDICLVARKHPSKGLDTFLNVYHTLPEETVKLIGNVTLISHDDLSSFDTSDMSVVNPGKDTDIADIYRRSGIFISTSWREGFGLPPLEAMACGCACIVSESGGIKEYVLPGKNSLTFPPKDETTLKDKLILILSNPSLQAALAQNGKRTASQFSWERSMRQFINVIS